VTRAGERAAEWNAPRPGDPAGREAAVSTINGHGTETRAARRPAPADYRTAEVRTVTMTVTALKVVATVGVLVPAFGSTVDTALVITIAIAAGGTLLRWVLRRAWWWVEDRLDDRAAAAWRAEHAHRC
jgi:hypothetical protein